MISITVVLCTYNRSGSLANALHSIAVLKLPESAEWEILVVDNNSNDRTREVVEDCCRRYPGRFRYVFEPQQGLSCARNAGIREARGEIIAFTDDDVTVEPMWLQNLTAPLHSGQWAGAGGQVIPVWTSACPSWLSLKSWYALGPLVMFNLGAEPSELTEPPFGANMVFRKTMFAKYGGFRTDLGNRPGSEIRNDDSEFGARLLANGERLRYEPSAVIYHPVPEERLDKKYFLKWWFDKGRADIRQSGIRPNTKYYLGGVPLYLFRNLAVWTLRWIAAVGPCLRFSRKLTVWGKMGEILECYRRSVDSKRGIVGTANSVPPEIVWPADNNHG
jgi:glycosyltransferase involved in cell wall biosynthesis